MQQLIHVPKEGYLFLLIFKEILHLVKFNIMIKNMNECFDMKKIDLVENVDSDSYAGIESLIVHIYF